MASYTRPPSFSDRRGSLFAYDELSLSTSPGGVGGSKSSGNANASAVSSVSNASNADGAGAGTVGVVSSSSSSSGAAANAVPNTIMKIVQARPPRGPPTPSMSTPVADYDQAMTGSPPPPPTPAASPGPTHVQPDWSDVAADEDFFHAKVRHHFKNANTAQRTRLLADLMNMCTSQQLSFVHQFVSPLLKKDPFMILPDELCLRVLSFIDDPKVLARASQVSRRWRDLLSDDMTWKNLCVKHDYGRRLSEVHASPAAAMAAAGAAASAMARATAARTAAHLAVTTGQAVPPPQRPMAVPLGISDSDYARHSMPPLASGSERFMASSRSFDGIAVGAVASGTYNANSGALSRRPKLRSYKSHFKQRYLVDAAWRSGGHSTAKNIAPDGGVVTSLYLTPNYIIVSLDNARIHVFDTNGENQRTLQGHVMGVWAIVPWDDTLVSGGCDRDVRVWDLDTGICRHTLRGHTSTVRCLKMSDADTAISGSRDTSLRVWDIREGLCRNVLVGHQASVRCLEIKGDIVVSGSYDTTAKVWSISEGRCLHTLQGHYSQIYAIAFDGVKIATGSLDTSVRIWNAATGECQAVLQGHTSLVGQLQMRGETLVTGGSDGSVRVWSLSRFCPIHRLAAHDNSVTSLQFDDTRVVSGGSDGRVKVWDLKTGQLVRELISHGEAVWRVAFEDEKCVAMALRNGRTVMEVWSFSPPEEMLYDRPPPLHLGKGSSSSSQPVSSSATVGPIAVRPMSAMALDYRRPSGLRRLRRDSDSRDVDMHDAGPATAPLQQGDMTFFQED